MVNSACSREALSFLPGHFVSLYDMLTFYAHKFFNISSSLTSLEHALTDDAGHPVIPTPEFCLIISERLRRTRPECLAIGLTFSVRQLDRVLQILEETDMAVIVQANLSGSILALSTRIQDELQELLFMRLTKEREPYYSDPRKQFGKPTLEKFPSIVSDVESAGECYATGNPTACVFHLMRVMERGLHALGKSLNDPSLDPKQNPNWQKILGRCTDELSKPLRDRSDLWRADELFFSQASAHLMAVKDAWRNPTMHVEQNYDDDQALAVFNAVRGFMSSLSIKLSE